jgi:beta-glucanase (GH16 family)
MALTATWQKSDDSTAANNCLEARLHEGKVQVRNSKAPEASVTEFTQGEWTSFLVGAANGEFDLPA